MGIKNLFTKEKKEVDEATLELRKELRKIKRKKIVKDVKTIGTIMLAAYGLGSIVGEIIVGVKMARRPKDQKFANGCSDPYEVAMGIISTIDNLKNDQMFLCTRQEDETDKTWVIRKAVCTDTEAVKTFNDHIEACLVEAKIQTPKIEG